MENPERVPWIGSRMNHNKSISMSTMSLIYQWFCELLTNNLGERTADPITMQANAAKRDR